MSTPLHLAVALDGAGWHPAAWREPAARPDELLSPGYWIDLVQLAERGLADFVTIEDSFGLQSNLFQDESGRTDQVRGRLDAVLTAARVAPLTSHIGLVPTVLVTHTEPFHVSKAIATLDYVSTGRAGVRVQLSAKANEAKHFGRRTLPHISADQLAQPDVQEIVADLFDEAADHVEVIRRLWDSWEDDAEIRDAATGRFIDRDKIHYIDFQSPHFSVKGPSIVPRPPQGQPLVTALAHSTVGYRLAGSSADIVYVTPADAADARRIVDEVRTEQRRSGRSTDLLHVFADVVVFLDTAAEPGAARQARLDDRAGAAYGSDAHVFAGSATALADLLVDWQASGITGFRLRPGVLPDDLISIVDTLVPELQQRNVFRTAYEAETLRGLLGFQRPDSRYTVPAGAGPSTHEEVSA